MTVPVGLSVAVQNKYGFHHIGSELDDLQFGTTSPGGYGDASFTLRRPLNITPEIVVPFSKVFIYDTRSATTVYAGRLQDPGRTADANGESYQLQAVGGQAHMHDDTRQLFYVDTELTRWEQVDKVTPGSVLEQISDLNDTGVPVFLLRIPMGTAVNPTDPSRAVAAHRGIAAAGQKIARISYNYDCGLTTANITHSMYGATEGVGAADIAFSTTFNTVSGATSRVIGTDWTAGRNRPIIRFHYTAAAANVSADTWWLQISGISLCTTRYTKAGVEQLTAASYLQDNVKASQVVEDLLGRVLTQTIDGANAAVSITSYDIEQLAYPDGTTPGKVLDDLCAIEQAYTWHVWEVNPDNGKFVFEWLPWPTTARYEADILEGFSSPASANTIYNQAAIRWHNRGTIRVSRYTSSVDALTDAGFDRTWFQDLGDEASTSANANRVGNQFLQEHRYPTNAGQLTISRPSIDHTFGREVQPYELRAGNVIRVQGPESYPGALNADGRDGLTLFRIAATRYDSQTNSATLDLDTYSLSVSRSLAALRRRIEAARRR